MRGIPRRAARVAVLLGLCLSVVLPSALAYTDDPPASPPFYGGVYVTGTTSQLGTVTVYIPSTYQEGYLGTTASGDLFNASNSSISGVVYAGSRQYDFRLSSWSTSQYCIQSGSYWEYEDLTFTSIDASNAEIALSSVPAVDASEILRYAVFLVLVVILLCLFIKRF